MREISTEKIKVGEHIIIDGVEYVVEDYDDCSECAFHNSEKCDAVPCSGIIFNKVEKEPQYRPYKDTDEMIDDYKKRFNVTHVPAISMPFIWIKEDGATYLITEFCLRVVCLGSLIVSLQSLFDRFTYLDGSPCGKVEE